MRGMVVGEGGRSSGVLLYLQYYCDTMKPNHDIDNVINLVLLSLLRFSMAFHNNAIAFQLHI